MKIWQEFGTEHSMRLVLIGRFVEVKGAEEAFEKIEKLIATASSEYDKGNIRVGGDTDRFSDKMLDVLRDLNFHDIAPVECEQLISDIRPTQKNDKIVITTDESDVSAFVKFLVHSGARVEIFSGHAYPEDEAKARE